MRKNDLDEIENITSEFTKGFLNKQSGKRMCFAICLPLQSFLSISGFKTELIEGEIETDEATWNHFWLKLPNNLIIDPTAAQFKQPSGKAMPKIYIGRKPGWYRELPISKNKAGEGYNER